MGRKPDPAKQSRNKNTWPKRPQRAPHVEPFTCTVPDAARLTGLGRSSLYKLMQDGTIKFRMVGDRRIVDLKSLRAAVAPLERT
jgi:excisionase family DNA binding protein